MIENSRREDPLRATDSAPKPGDFPIGSVESRAAARMIAEKIANRPKLVRRIVFVPPGLDEAKVESLEGANCFRRVEGADTVWESWGWDMDDL